MKVKMQIVGIMLKIMKKTTLVSDSDPDLKGRYIYICIYVYVFFPLGTEIALAPGVGGDMYAHTVM